MKLKARLREALSLSILPFIILAVLVISHMRSLDNYELETLDARFLLRPRMTATDEAVLIEIGEDSIEKLGRFPFDRSYHALLVKALSEFGAKAVVFDIFFSEDGEHDSELEETMREAGNVYLPFVFDIDAEKRSNILEARGYTARTIENLRILTKGEGHINIAPDSDGKFRRVPLYVRYKNAFYPYISLLAACDYLGISQKEVSILPGKYLMLGKKLKIPLDERSNMIINFSGRWGKVYKHYSYVDILQSYLSGLSGQKPILDLGIFKGKICIVGLTAAGTVDLHPSPLEPLYPGVGIHAEVFNSILNKRFIARPSKETNTAVLMVLLLFISVATFKTRPVKGLSILIIAIVLFSVACILSFNLYGIWLDLFLPILGMALVYLSFTFRKLIIEWKKRLLLENELGIARRIQESFLPKALPAVEGVEIACGIFTARQVGGDMYDFAELGSEGLGVMIGDVSGKGIPASLFMAMVMAEFRSFATPNSKPHEILASLNSRLVRESSTNLFVTSFYLVFDLKDKVVSYSNGGHLPAVYLRHTGELEFLDVDVGAPLGLMEGPYADREMNFDKGDTFVLYTDGVTEAMNPRSEMYGRDRLASVIASAKGLSSSEMVSAIEKDVRSFEPKSRQHDDMTLVVVKIV